jgi:DNA-binding response OmpR family regulator
LEFDGEYLMKSILVVDDEKRLVSLVEAYLKQDGFNVFTAFDGKEAYHLALSENLDLIILDIMMPKLNGNEFLELYRKDHDTPIIMLTARVDEDDKVISLEMGADDYVTKPFRPRELLARVHAVLRRAEKNKPIESVMNYGEISLDRNSRIVKIKERYVDLTPTEFDLLSALMASPGYVFSRMDLLEMLQGVRYEGYERTIDLHIKNLRAKIGEDHPPKYIQSIYGVGYRFARE